MQLRQWQVGVLGTFDVENYGDLLFPLVAEAELTARLGAVELHRFSYNTRNPPVWPYPVTSVSALPEMAGRLDGLLIGGGFLIRFDKEVAPGYGPPSPAIHHPTGYWLTPALIAVQQGIPLIWNAPGMHRNEIPAWADPLMELAFSHSRYVAVRDKPSQAALARFAGIDRISVVPDTAFGLPRLFNGEPSSGFDRLREASGLTGPYIVIQAALGLKPFARFVKKHADRFRDYQFLALPIGPVLGDDAAILEEDLPGIVRLPTWPHPLLLAEVIRHAEAVVGHSYHLAVTALTAGVPAFTHQDLSAGKYSALSSFEAMYQLETEREPDPDWFLARVGKKAALSPAVKATLDPLAAHWDRVAAALQAGVSDSNATLNRFWQALPGLLEDPNDLLTQARADIAERDRRIMERDRRLIERGHRIAALYNSNSWKISSPLRFAGRRLRGNGTRQNMINLDRITQHKLETEPYRHAVIDQLFSPEDAAALASSYPHDHFKLLSARGGEKDYEYEARNLIGMGAQAATFPEDLSKAWRTFAADLVSPAYRGAMSQLTGCDLTESPLEVNVFHYGPGASLGAHPDLSDKVITHVFYFNDTWNPKDGGCLSILRSSDPKDIVTEVPPLVGTSAVLVRSDNSWHAVSPVANGSRLSRRSVTVTFYRPGSQSSMWPENDPTPLHRYGESNGAGENGRTGSWWSRLAPWRK